MRNESEYIKVIFSNRLDRLADALAEQLFGHKNNPFENRYVIVPNDLIKTFLNYHFATKLGIAAGMRFYSMEHGATELLEHAHAAVKKRIPSHLELATRIEEQIHFFLTLTNQKMEPLYTPLSIFLEDHEMRDQRILFLSDQLSRLFVRYGEFGKEWCKEWLNKPGWQQWIWQRIFSEERIISLDTLSQTDVPGLCVHVFGFSYLPPAYFSFFARAQALFYLFSPCAQYWDDLCSDKQKLFIQSRLDRQGVSPQVRDEMQHYLQDHHPLLANWGRLGREFAKTLDDYSLHIEELYELSEPSLLGYVKNSMLFLEDMPQDWGTSENNHSKAQAIQSDIHCRGIDHSIQIHSAPSKLREVEVLKSVLCTLLAEHASDASPLQPQDILVLAPDIAHYVPYIRMVFGTSLYAYQVNGLEQGSLSDFCQAFRYLLSLTEQEWSLSSLMKLFSCTAFQKRWSFTEEEVDRIHSWLKTAGVRVGEQSWEDGIARLLLGLALSAEGDDGKGVYPISCIAQSDMELFNQFLVCYYAVKKDVALMRSLEKKNLAEWLNWLEDAAIRHCQCEVESEPFLKQLRSVRQQTSSVISSCFSFTSIQRIVRHLFEKRTGVIAAEHLNHIRFGSMHSAVAGPARVIYLLGLDEEHFPRYESPLSFSELTKRCYFPLKSDEDRYLFLELLCSAQDYFILSYERNNPLDNKPQGPSYLIEELRTFTARYSPLSCLQIDHPILSFDPMYFVEGTPIHNLDPSDFQLAVANAAKGCEARSFFKASGIKNEREDLEEEIRISSLCTLAKNPMKFYFNKALGMYLNPDTAHVDERFGLSSLKKFFLKRQVFEQSFDKALQDSDRQGCLPEGMFKKVAISALSLETTESQEYYDRLGIRTQEVFSIEFSMHCRSPFRLEQGSWILPAIFLKSRGKNLCYIVGTLNDVHMNGFIAHGKKDLHTLITAWPSYLIYAYAGRITGGFSERILCMKDGTQIDMAFDDPITLLEDYIGYYHRAQLSLSPLLPKWASCLLYKGEEDLERSMYASMNESATGYSDPYLEWMRRSQIHLDAKKMHRNWSSYFKELFSPLLKSMKNHEE